MATETQSPVQVFERKDTIIGQPQARPSDPHDGSTLIHETVVHTDQKILDPNDPLAVQVPEGSGASTVGYTAGLAEAIASGTAEEQFARGRDAQAPEAVTPGDTENSNKAASGKDASKS